MQVSIEKRGSIGIIWVDNPPVNAISHAVREGLIAAVDSIAGDDETRAIILACRGRTFMAGADITEFATGPKPPGLSEVVEKLSASEKPIVAALFGTAFGGGLEVALGCNYRIASPTTRIGLPEVKLGILPGAQGTQRLPRVAGVDFALDLIVSGDPAPAAKAHAAGAIDRIADSDIVSAATEFAKELVSSRAPLIKSHELSIDATRFDDGYFAAFRQSIARRSRGMNAPERCIQAVEAAIRLPFADGIVRERDLIREAFADPQSSALQHVFFAERLATKIPGLAHDVKPRPIASVGIIGAGTMGGGISMNFANAGIPVTLLEMNEEALHKGLDIIRKNYQASAHKGRITDAQVAERMGKIRGTTHYKDLGDPDLVIEAVFESMDVKKEVFSKLSATMRPDTILASNTSYLDIDEIATMVTNPERVLGMHFFSPANVMRLLEIVRANKTSREVLATIIRLAKTIKKTSVVAGVCHGFIGNRMLSAYMREANLLVLEGAPPEQVDRALYDFGMPMGVFAMTDLAGIDIGYRLRQQLDESSYDRRAYHVNDRLAEMGRLGQKTNAGIYDYEPGSRLPVPSPLTGKLISEAADSFGIVQREISDGEIIERCFYSLFNVGCDVLDEGIAYRASDIDIVFINGYGFPAWRGGPMYWAEQEIGLDRVLNRIHEFSDEHGSRWWTPSPLLERLVANGETLKDIRSN
jgi:3-hydroxyacyl-CoA dehydrogenase